jgi:membrane-bound lytic murein transglycosylase B
LAAADPLKAEPQAKPKVRPDRPTRSKPATAQAAAKSRPPAKASRASAILIGSGPAYADRVEAMDFAQRLALERELPAEWLRSAIGQARRSPQVIQLMQPPSSPLVKNWRAYRSRFIEEVRIQAGLRFWQTHRADLARAEAVYGVPPEIVVGIIGVETLYGRHMGQFRVLDALTTLAFDFPERHPRAAERSQYFRKELEQFLLAQHRSQSDPLEPLGSYAGATGMPQFMPSSIASFAVDFDGDGRIDLRTSISDVIGSVAHYLKAFNWKPGMPTHYPVQLKPDADLSALLAPDILPTFSAQAFQDKGAILTEPATSHGGPLALIELLNGADAPSFVAGTENFYVITRYNWSSYYAMAVIELGQAIARRKNQGG